MRHPQTVFAALGASLVTACASSAIVTDWTSPTGGAFSLGANWSDGAPGIEDTARFALAATYAVTLDDAAAVDRILVHAGSVTLDLDHSLVTFATTALLPSVIVAESPRQQATLRLAGEQSLAGSFVHVADATTAVGTIVVEDDALLAVDNVLHIGRRGAGALLLDGGNVSARRLNAGSLVTGIGVVEVVDGALGVVETVTVGQFGDGSLLLDDGSMMTTGDLILALQRDATGSMRLEGASHALIAGNADIGLGGDGSLEILDGSTVTIDGAFLSLATLPASVSGPPLPPSTALVQLAGSGSSLIVSADLYAPFLGVSEIDLGAGTSLAVGGDLVIGRPLDSTFRMELAVAGATAPIDVVGNVSPSAEGAASLHVEFELDASLAYGDAFDLITAAEILADFDVTLPPLPGALIWSTAIEDDGFRRTLRARIDTDADLNGDGAVDAADLGLLLTAWGTSGPGDLNGDGIVDGADLAILLLLWSVR